MMLLMLFLFAGLFKLVHVLANISSAELNHKLDEVKRVRYYFTYAGVLDQIDRFLSDPFGTHGGELRCTIHPRTERCCDSVN
jgi:hypothetical protein